MNRRADLILTVLVSLCASAGLEEQVRAESRGKQSAESHYDKGMKAYTLGHFPEAIEEFEKAFELRSEPIFLYNIAQSHRQNNSPQRAIFFYRRYLEAEPNAKNRAEIEKRIKDMESQLNAQKERDAVAASAAVTVPTPAAAPVATQPPVFLPPAQNPPVQTLERPVAAQAENDGRGLRIGGMVAGGVGLAAIGAGIIFQVHSKSLHDEAYFPPAGKGYDDAKAKSSDTYGTLGWVFVGVGGAALVTGGVLYYLGVTAKPATGLALSPMVGSGAGGAVLTGRF